MSRTISTREEFKDYCLRRLGAPVINIEVDDEQVQDRIDDALLKFRDYHFDGTQHTYYKIKVEQADLDNQYFTVPEDLVGITRIFKLGGAHNISNLFNIRYQIHLNDLFNYTSATYTPYVMAMRHIETLQELFVGEIPIRFNRHTNRLYLDMDWKRDAPLGTWIIVEGYKTINPEENPDVWNDPWLRQYATALIKQQWGMNITKYVGSNLPGGIQYDGTRILQEANDTLEKLDADVINSYSLPVHDMMN